MSLRLKPKVTRVAVALAAASALSPAALSAQFAVYDPVNYAENVLHYTHQLMQIQYQLQALAKLQFAPWRDVSGPLGQIGLLMGQPAGQPAALGYAAPSVATTFDGLFPVSRVVTDWPREQLARAQTAVSLLKAAVLSTSQQQSAVAPGETALEQMKALNGSVQGHEQALELQNSAAVYSAQELMLLRQAAMAQTNIQAVYYANQLNADAQRDATARATLDGLAVLPAPVPDVSLRVAP
jgi:conjugal transfer/entry exclusion protein